MNKIIVALLFYAHTVFSVDYVPVLSLSNIKPTQSICFSNGIGNKMFCFDFSGDTIKTTGELQPDSAAMIFIKYVKEHYKLYNEK